jgi:predicted GIY-YIG superfamily endonuclease
MHVDFRAVDHYQSMFRRAFLVADACCFLVLINEQTTRRAALRNQAVIKELSRYARSAILARRSPTLPVAFQSSTTDGWKTHQFANGGSDVLGPSSRCIRHRAIRTAAATVTGVGIAVGLGPTAGSTA